MDGEGDGGSGHCILGQRVPVWPYVLVPCLVFECFPVCLIPPELVHFKCNIFRHFIRECHKPCKKQCGENKDCQCEHYKDKNINIKDHKDAELEYYFRFTAYDKPGVLAQISAILGSHNISIASVIQKGKAKYVPLVMMTHKSVEGNMFKAKKEIEKLECIKGKGQLIRVLDN